jgi:hypothetical protein
MRIKYFIFFFFLLPAFCSAELVEIKYFQKDQRYKYRIELLKLALSKSAREKDQIIYQPFAGEITQSRGIYFLKNNPEFINIAFLPTNKEREESLIAVKKPMLYGMLGYRIFLIHKDNKSKFENINSIKPFIDGSLLCGFGSQWADMKILNYNKINTVGVAVYDYLFKALEHKRFDYFPRGINEAFEEIKTKKNEYPNIIIEDNLAFHYPYPVYFFVNKNNQKLASRIKKGLELAEKDGSFKELFLKHHKDIIKKANLSKRKIISLKNPEIPDNPEIDFKWWMKQF